MNGRNRRTGRPAACPLNPNSTGRFRDENPSCRDTIAVTFNHWAGECGALARPAVLAGNGRTTAGANGEAMSD
ncbi:hypothetical protein [Haladaptatus cibarius]|uniref:hypothetical protein n=1 Tax=Haladaptatus cibarius TaxID=453847 RepID=UPI000A968637|nr:hypothetical protein [Haladaptatus cibarius]